MLNLQQSKNNEVGPMIQQVTYANNLKTKQNCSLSAVTPFEAQVSCSRTYFLSLSFKKLILITEHLVIRTAEKLCETSKCCGCQPGCQPLLYLLTCLQLRVKCPFIFCQVVLTKRNIEKYVALRNV